MTQPDHIVNTVGAPTCFRKYYCNMNSDLINLLLQEESGECIVAHRVEALYSAKHDLPVEMQLYLENTKSEHVFSFVPTYQSFFRCKLFKTIFFTCHCVGGASDLLQLMET
jgi:hypothetical protein